jgi:hypothetical protein
MALSSIISALTSAIGLPKFPERGKQKFQYLDTRFKGVLTASGPLIAEDISIQLGESLMCGTKYLSPNPLLPSKALPPHIIATPLSHLLNFGGVTATSFSSLSGVNSFTGITDISGIVNLNGSVNINGKNLEVELALGKSLPPSDERLKKNIHTITNPIEKVSALRGVSFEFKESGKKEIGFIAQEVEKVLPEIVGENSDGYKGVQYQNVVGLLVEAIKEQQKQIDELRRQVNG